MSKESDTDLPSLISESSDTAAQQPSHARVAPVLPPPTATKVNKLCDRHSNIEVTLDGKELWDEFYRRGTEMIVTPSGRPMFPRFSVSISGLRPTAKYTMKLDIVLADNHRFKFLKARWLAVGSSEPQPAYETYIHTDSPNTGSFWMRQGVLFRKLKITNNKDKAVQNAALLHSMHKYFIRLVIDKERNSPPGEPKPVPRPILTMEFPETTFIAVTAYQNKEVIQLKVSNNLFAQGIRGSVADIKSPPGEPKPVSRRILTTEFPETAVTAYQNEEVAQVKISKNPAFRESVADMDWKTAQALYSLSSYGVVMTHSGNYFSHSPWGIQSPMVSPVPHTPFAMQPVPHFQLHQQQIPVHHQSLSRLQYSPESPILGPFTAKESEYFNEQILGDSESVLITKHSNYWKHKS